MNKTIKNKMQSLTVFVEDGNGETYMTSIEDVNQVTVIATMLSSLKAPVPVGSISAIDIKKRIMGTCKGCRFLDKKNMLCRVPTIKGNFALCSESNIRCYQYRTE
ncbi:hypothetical protein [Bacteroides salyersiae]|uniref:Uncharacterized protein n=2 Tax=Bacteroides salyersiae TaxID=291644 RepID=A0A7J4XLX6_9BACE|nr:hypothetical protein [Bacteroides salyersiae]KAA3694852.1 hypothetical protein F3F90_02705 [Bacteroides salyersiae]KAA3698094.1 hypothetical protein F3F89_06780 [Bacteroides salyersiae]KAA3703127.1 hypothetical protein F3F83_21530 [Bacteroides salyersiae]KAA3713400.1 hypothetical protein F3G09_06955 [Bacteroides salyersiae]KAA3714612.1 hypothetical protein F3G06_05360 [Bacteroides salyersiae]